MYKKSKTLEIKTVKMGKFNEVSNGSVSLCRRKHHFLYANRQDYPHLCNFVY